MNERFKLLVTNLKEELSKDVLEKLNQLNVDVLFLPGDRDIVKFMKTETPDLLLIDLSEVHRRAGQWSMDGTAGQQ